MAAVWQHEKLTINTIVTKNTPETGFFSPFLGDFTPILLFACPFRQTVLLITNHLHIYPTP
jgi:hypothetical protein